ncbi:Abi-like protein [Flavobacterium psychrophilum]|nr:Abi-like protein [Flavobacterium psychrophilum]SNA87626.1 Abi-like protein [Flavobacterium psychrophilum]SNB14883.1 Abi-like protein [Flavobacterium psychrophilum]SNB38742.1 Abi-like protein [Flavobacterium psychrophilum]
MPIYDAHFGGFSIFIKFHLILLMMLYKKEPITISEQIEKLQSRGLQINNTTKAAHYLSNISYYRLRAYTYPFQNNKDENQPFIKEIKFEEIINLYVFDRQLRLLIFNAIEKIEVSFRTQIIYQYSLAHGSHWHLKPELYNNSVYFAEHIASLQKEIDRSNETFIKHYKQKYTKPTSPPSWMSLEVSSMGLLSKLFKNLKKDDIKNSVAQYYGLKDVDLFSNWMFCLSILRNTCAHHGRVWNRRLPEIAIPRKTLYPYVENKQYYTNKTYAVLCNVVYLLNIISPEHSFKANLVALMNNCPLAQEKEMGFPVNWKEDNFWK